MQKRKPGQPHKGWKSAVRKRNEDHDARVYPCFFCGKLRSRNEGGIAFSACDECYRKMELKRRNRTLSQHNQADETAALNIQQRVNQGE